LHGQQAAGKLSMRSKRRTTTGVFMATRRTTGSVRTAEAAAPAEKAAAARRNAPVKAAKAPESSASEGITVSQEMRRAMIEQAAYLRAERRGFTPGSEVEDWLAAETEVDALLRAGNGRTQ
jgi:Protein of unknown function (DUF2934)